MTRKDLRKFSWRLICRVEAISEWLLKKSVVEAHVDVLEERLVLHIGESRTNKAVDVLLHAKWSQFPVAASHNEQRTSDDLNELITTSETFPGNKSVVCVLSFVASDTPSMSGK